MKKDIKFVMSYDSEADAAYLYLSKIGAAEISETVTCDEVLEGFNGDINLDFDSKQTLRGIEILNASKILPKQLLEELL